MNDVHFNTGVEFNFTGSTITSLAPGARALIVRDLAASLTAADPGRSRRTLREAPSGCLQP